MKNTLLLLLALFAGYALAQRPLPGGMGTVELPAPADVVFRIASLRIDSVALPPDDGSQDPITRVSVSARINKSDKADGVDARADAMLMFRVAVKRSEIEAAAGKPFAELTYGEAYDTVKAVAFARVTASLSRMAIP
jgi:hypothetical protein